MLNKKVLLSLTAGLSLISVGSLNVMASSEGNDVKPSNGSTLGYIDQNGQSYRGDDGSSSDSKSVNGQSDAHVSVTKGYLTLNVVPSFGFGSISSKTSNQTVKNTIDNKAILQDDSLYGKNENTISVTDSRYDNTGNNSVNGQSGDKKSKAEVEDGVASNGYEVSATMGNFQPENGGTLSGDVENGDNFELSLPNGQFETDSGNNVVQGQNGFRLKSNGQSVNSIIKADKVGTGNSSVTFNGGSLTVPANIKPGNYAAPITWTLTPTAENAG